MFRNQFLKGLISLPFFGAAGVVKAVEPVGEKPFEPNVTQRQALDVDGDGNENL